MRISRVCLLFAAVLSAALPAAQADPVIGYLAHLHGADVVPAVISAGGATFRGTLALISPILTYQVHYFRLKGNVTEIDLNAGQPGVNGGTMVVLCSNLGTAPAGTQPCPTTLPATIRGQVPPSVVVGGASSQGVDTGDIIAFSTALNSGLAYVTIRTDLFPAGEVRGQISSFVISPD